jgi:signal transduction histidine kinase/ligand-binding sensor domain-containing protein/DNA-binding response OmpR family regulator
MLAPKRSCIIFLCLFCTGMLLFNVCRAQHNLEFKKFTLNEGLSQSPIFSLFQDKKGLIWIGSRDGLTRYDGYEFKVYKNEASLNTSVSNSDIISIYEDGLGNLWLGTANGLFIFDRLTGKFTKYNIGVGKYIYHFLPYNSDHFLLATDDGIKYYNFRTKQVDPGKLNVLPKQRIYALFSDSQNRLWAGLREGIKCLDLNTGKNRVLPYAIVNSKLYQSKVVVVRESKGGDLWFGTDNMGVFQLNNNGQTCVSYTHTGQNGTGIPSNFVRDIYISKDESVWIATRGGLSVYNTLSKKFTNYKHQVEIPHTLSHNTIWNIMKDKTGSIWLSTYAGGINIYNPGNANFHHIGERIGNNPGLNYPVTNALAEDKEAGLWVGTDGGGLNYINRKLGYSRYISVTDDSDQKTSNVVKAIANDTEGHIWIGMLDGLARVDSKTGALHRYNLEKKGDARGTRVNTIAADADGIWVGTDTIGLTHLSKNGTIRNFAHNGDLTSISNNHINSILTDVGLLWVGTNNGLNAYNKRTYKFTRYYPNPSQARSGSNVVLSLYNDSHNRVWVGTMNGLYLMGKDSRSFTPINDKGKLNGIIIQAITEDDKGNIWVSTKSGLWQIGLNSGTNKRYVITHYSSADGLSSNQFIQNAVLRAHSGELMFGGVNGITIFHPHTIIRNTYKPNVIITDFLIHNRSVTPQNYTRSALKFPFEETRDIVLTHDQAAIAFKFSALNYFNSQNNQYAYRLEGLDKKQEWHYAGNQRIASYTNLVPGSYIFMVKASNNEGLWNNRETRMALTILPPIWLTWWAYCLYVVLVTAVLIVVIRFFRMQAKLERDLFYEHLQYERQQELHQMKLDFFTNISHEIRTPLTLITGPLEKLVNETLDKPLFNRQLRQIQNNSGRLLRLVSELMDFRKAETGNMKLYVSSQDVVKYVKEIYLSFENLAVDKHLQYDFVTSADKILLHFDRDQMEKVIFNLLSNAFKFTPEGGKISVIITETVKAVSISINDNGKGISYDNQEKLFTSFYQVEGHHAGHLGSGIGLALSKSIIELHKGSIAITSSPQTANAPGNTNFTLTLLKGNQHFDKGQLIDDYIQTDQPEQHKLYSQLSTTLTEVEIDADDDKKAQVLVVEDNDEVREFITGALGLQYKVITSANGKEGLEAANRYIPDLIVSDVMMPEMNGIELCRILKTQEATSHIPVILLTARAAYVHQVDGLETGADAYITKPFSIQVLELNIRNLLKARDVMRQKFCQQMLLQPKDVIISSNEEKFISKLMDIIETHMSNPDYSVVNLASDIGMSQSVLYRKIKSLSDLSITDFIKSVRLKRAAMLLAQDQLSISEVAFAVGFNNRKYFSKEFRKMYDQTPTAYNARYTGKPDYAEEED